MNTKLLSVTFTVAALSLFAFGASAQRPAPSKRPAPAERIKPDLIVKDLKIDRVGEDASGGDRVKITAIIMNTRSGTSTGPFKVRFEWTDNPRAGWNLIQDAGVANLRYSPASAKIPTAKLTANHVVPRGASHKIRVTADSRVTAANPRGDVDESSETNNVQSAGYVDR